MEKKTLKDKGLKACENCSYWYNDGFCMQHCYYTEVAYFCPKWTDEDIEFSKKETHIGKLVVWGQWGLLAELKEEILEIIND